MLCPRPRGAAALCCPRTDTRTRGHTDTSTHSVSPTPNSSSEPPPDGHPWLREHQCGHEAMGGAGTRGARGQPHGRELGRGQRDPPEPLPICTVGSGTVLGAAPQRGELTTSSAPAPHKGYAGSRGLRDAPGYGAAVGMCRARPIPAAFAQREHPPRCQHSCSPPNRCQNPPGQMGSDLGSLETEKTNPKWEDEKSPMGRSGRRIPGAPFGTGSGVGVSLGTDPDIPPGCSEFFQLIWLWGFVACRGFLPLWVVFIPFFPLCFSTRNAGPHWKRDEEQSFVIGADGTFSKLFPPTPNSCCQSECTQRAETEHLAACCPWGGEMG